MNKRMLAARFCLFPQRADIGAEEAFAIACSQALQKEPALDADETVVRKFESEKMLLIELSEPYHLDGECFWRTFNHYESMMRSVSRRSRFGDRVMDLQAQQAQGNFVSPAHSVKVAQWLAFWGAEVCFDESLRIAARPVKVYLFFFARGIYGPSALVGVDGEGNLFCPNVEAYDFPWNSRVKARREQMKIAG